MILAMKRKKTQEENKLIKHGKLRFRIGPINEKGALNKGFIEMRELATRILNRYCQITETL